MFKRLRVVALTENAGAFIENYCNNSSMAFASCASVVAV